jgi:hypothetical protein
VVRTYVFQKRAAKSPLHTRSEDDRTGAKTAIRLLSICSTSARNEACVVAKGATIDARMVEATHKAHITEMRQRLDQTAGIAKAAEACAEAGNIEKALVIALDIEQLDL